MRKKIVAAVALILLIVSLVASFAACSGNIYQKRLIRAGYNDVEYVQNQVPYVFINEDGEEVAYDVQWYIIGIRAAPDVFDKVTIVKFEQTEHAKNVEEYAAENSNRVIYRMGALFFSATSEEALKDVLYVVG